MLVTIGFAAGCRTTTAAAVGATTTSRRDSAYPRLKCHAISRPECRHRKGGHGTERPRHLMLPGPERLQLDVNNARALAYLQQVFSNELSPRHRGDVRAPLQLHLPEWPCPPGPSPCKPGTPQRPKAPKASIIPVNTTAPLNKGVAAVCRTAR